MQAGRGRGDEKSGVGRIDREAEHRGTTQSGKRGIAAGSSARLRLRGAPRIREGLCARAVHRSRGMEYPDPGIISEIADVVGTREKSARLSGADPHFIISRIVACG